jgi:hypothetical protein
VTRLRSSSSTIRRIKWDMTHSYVPDMGVCQGHNEVRQFFKQWREFFAEDQAAPVQFTTLTRA